MIKTWEELSFWSSVTWDSIQQKLDTLDLGRHFYCPKREDIFLAMDILPLEEVRVMFLGQDPYPDPLFATGLAFSIPKYIKEYETTFPYKRKWPPTLTTILREYSKDLHYPFPTSGDLSNWCKEGVFLWNAFPTCLIRQSLSHNAIGWHELTKEILEVLSQRGILFVLLGSVARDFQRYINEADCEIIVTSHPSPRGSLKSKSPFTGSRIFSTINDKLVALGEKPIDWRLT